MWKTGRAFLSRVFNPDFPYDPQIHSTEDLVVTEIKFSQITGQAASIDVTCQYPEEGLMSSNRWAIISCEMLYDDGSVGYREIARGEMSTFPIALAGDTVTIEILCRRPNFSSALDTAYAAHNSLVPDTLEPPTVARRTQAYLISEPYVDPRTLEVSLDPISGSAEPAMTILGEGASAGESQIFGMTFDMTETPCQRVSLEAEARFDEVRYGIKDLLAGSPFSTSIDTYTPVAFRDSLNNVSLTGGYEMIFSLGTVQPQNQPQPYPGTMRIYTSERKTDMLTCVIQPADYVEYDLYKIENPSIIALIKAVQPRKETFCVDVEPVIQNLPSEDVFKEETSIIDAGKLARIDFTLSYSTSVDGGASITTLRSRETLRSAMTATDQFGTSVRPEADQTAKALIRKAARIAVIRAHCVELTLDVSIEVALSLTLKDRVRILDVRLPNTQAVGKVTGISFTLAESDRAEISILCPISNMNEGFGSVQLDGLETVSAIDPQLIGLTSAQGAYVTPLINDLKTGQDANLERFRTSLQIFDAADDQATALNGTDGIDTWNPDPQIVTTSIELGLAGLDAMDVEEIPEFRPTLNIIRVFLPEGITL